MFTAAPIAMDLRTAVYNAARDGKLKLLQKLLGSRSREELEALTAGPGGGDGPGGGSTPLLIAARHGHLEVVEYLLDHCGARVEEGGSVNFDGETIEGPRRCGLHPPLGTWGWCAASWITVPQ